MRLEVDCSRLVFDELKYLVKLPAGSAVKLVTLGSDFYG